MTWQISAHYAARSVAAAYYAGEYAKTTDERIERACGGVERAAVVKCVAEQVEASREDQRTEYDLEAQQDSADAAFWMALVSTAALLATVVALWYVKRTMDATWRVVEEAGKATQAAKDVAHIELRPWIQISIEPHSGFNDPDRVSIYCMATLRNLGRTPAQDVRVGTTAAPLPLSYYRKYGPQELISLPDEDMRKWQPVLPGGEITQLVSFNLLWEDADPPFMEGEDRFMCPYVGVHVTYSLGDGRQGETATTFQIGLPESERKVSSFDQSHDRELDLAAKVGVRAKIT